MALTPVAAARTARRPPHILYAFTSIAAAPFIQMASLSSTAADDPAATPTHELWAFPPLFTLQRHAAIRERQMQVWQSIVLEHHRTRQESILDVSTAPYFRNSRINRWLDPQEAEAVLEYIASKGHGEWMDAQKSQFLVMWDTAQELANAIYNWAEETGKVGEIFTVYDIHGEDDSEGQIFHGIHPRAVVKALIKLQDGGKAQISRSQGKPLDEWGVKFLALS